jgi:hypothetical protein
VTEALVIMAKEPRPGLVKTRLVPRLTQEQASAFYAAMLEDVLSQTTKEHTTRSTFVAFHPLTARPWFVARTNPPLRSIPQRGPDLGTRLAKVFDDIAMEGYTRMVVRNSDSPDLPVETLEAAFATLASSDVVLCPDSGGGYGVVGLNRPCPELFTSVEMSTESVLARTLELTRRLGLRASLLDPVPDIDTSEDLDRLVRTITESDPRSRRRIPATVAMLEELGLLDRIA